MSLTARLDPARFTIATMPVRLEKLGDLVAPVLREESDIASIRVTCSSSNETAPLSCGGRMLAEICVVSMRAWPSSARTCSRSWCRRMTHEP